MQNFRRLLAAVACVLVGAASFALSFVALRDVAVSTQAVPDGLGWLVPVVIDGGVICGSAVLWSQSKEASRRQVFPFLFVAALVTVSVVVNVNHAGPSLLAKTIAGLPPLILLGTLELVASQGRRAAVPVQFAPADDTPPTPIVNTGFQAEDAVIEVLEREFAEQAQADTSRAVRSRTSDSGRRQTRVRAQAAEGAVR